MADCIAVRSDGTPCRAHALRTGVYCFFHDPAKRAALIRAARKGGARRSIELPEGEPLAPDRTRAIISYIVEAIASGAMDAETARALAHVLRVDIRLHETVALEQRVAGLELIVKALQPSQT